MANEQTEDLAALVEETIRALHDKGIAAADLVPLVKLYDAVKAPDKAAPPLAGSAVLEAAATTEPAGPYGRDGRRGEVKASEALMARASAIIDVLVQGGQSAEQATQIITRQLLSVGIQLPESGGDARAWKRLLNWRNNLIHYKRAGKAWDVYCEFKEKLASIPPAERLRAAVGERLWDERKAEFSSADIA